MIRMPTIALATLASAALGWQALAQHAGHPPADTKMGQMKTDPSKMDHSKMDHSKMGHGAAAAKSGTEEAPSTKAFKAANDKMHEGMAIPFTGNADVDFVKGMIPHHQGAVEMARIVLQYGKDPALKKLARDIISAQDKEIAFMRRWLAKQGKS